MMPVIRVDDNNFVIIANRLNILNPGVFVTFTKIRRKQKYQGNFIFAYISLISTLNLCHKTTCSILRAWIKEKYILAAFIHRPCSKFSPDAALHGQRLQPQSPGRRAWDWHPETALLIFTKIPKPFILSLCLKTMSTTPIWLRKREGEKKKYIYINTAYVKTGSSLSLPSTYRTALMAHCLSNLLRQRVIISENVNHLSSTGDYSPLALFLKRARQFRRHDWKWKSLGRYYDSVEAFDSISLFHWLALF